VLFADYQLLIAFRWVWSCSTNYNFKIFYTKWLLLLLLPLLIV